MKLLIDTNVALDILLNRHPYYTNAALIYSLTRQHVFSSYISASAVTDIFYIVKKDLGKKHAKEIVKTLLQVFKPATVTDNHVYKALALDWDDFEDAVQFIVGESFTADYIITRNIQDFTASSIPAISPEQFIQLTLYS